MRFTNRSRPDRPADSFPCPHCGGDVPPSRRACPHCGASESDGWRREDEDEGEPDDEGESDDDPFDYEEFVAREFGEREPSGSPAADPKRLILWLIIAAMLLASFALLG